ncbi:hypothetical protein ANO11243_031590 [Dothideomycetidae sp. 11243]|nr:hypothetical protein ANO11243_031590 [fungal sp. No.11243]
MADPLKSAAVSGMKDGDPGVDMQARTKSGVSCFDHPALAKSFGKHLLASARRVLDEIAPLRDQERCVMSSYLLFVLGVRKEFFTYRSDGTLETTYTEDDCVQCLLEGLFCLVAGLQHIEEHDEHKTIRWITKAATLRNRAAKKERPLLTEWRALLKEVGMPKGTCPQASRLLAEIFDLAILHPTYQVRDEDHKHPIWELEELMTAVSLSANELVRITRHTESNVRTLFQLMEKSTSTTEQQLIIQDNSPTKSDIVRLLPKTPNTPSFQHDMDRHGLSSGRRIAVPEPIEEMRCPQFGQRDHECETEACTPLAVPSFGLITLEDSPVSDGPRTPPDWTAARPTRKFEDESKTNEQAPLTKTPEFPGVETLRDPLVEKRSKSRRPVAASPSRLYDLSAKPPQKRDGQHIPPGFSAPRGVPPRSSDMEVRKIQPSPLHKWTGQQESAAPCKLPESKRQDAAQRQNIPRQPRRYPPVTPTRPARDDIQGTPFEWKNERVSFGVQKLPPTSIRPTRDERQPLRRTDIVFKKHVATPDQVSTTKDSAEAQQPSPVKKTVPRKPVVMGKRSTQTWRQILKWLPRPFKRTTEKKQAAVKGSTQQRREAAVKEPSATPSQRPPRPSAPPAPLTSIVATKPIPSKEPVIPICRPEPTRPKSCAIEKTKNDSARTGTRRNGAVRDFGLDPKYSLPPLSTCKPGGFTYEVSMPDDGDLLFGSEEELIWGY